MTQAEFIAFYPQFADFTPVVVLTTYIAQANARFSAFTPAPVSPPSPPRTPRRPAASTPPTA